MKIVPAARSKARRFAVQALYQAQMTGDSLGVIERQFREDHDMKRVDTTYLHELLTGVASGEESLWERMSPLFDRAADEVTPVERAVLLVSGFELFERIDVPYRVVIDEAIELAQLFGASESFRFINAVLDKAALEARVAETSRR